MITISSGFWGSSFFPDFNGLWLFTFFALINFPSIDPKELTEAGVGFSKLLISSSALVAVFDHVRAVARAER